MPKNKRSGLGTQAFFQDADSSDGERNPPAKAQEARSESPSTSASNSANPRKKRNKRKKLRTTVMMYADTMAHLEELKIEQRREGIRATYSDILEQAMQALLEKRALNS